MKKITHTAGANQMKTPDLKEQIGTPFRCSNHEHYFASEHIPNFPIWIRKCMTCGFYDTWDMNEQLDKLVAQKQIEAKIEGALFALDNETLWQYKRLCNMSMVPKPTYRWFIETIQRNINKYKSELKSLTKEGEKI